jgi:hypothetical protein
MSGQQAKAVEEVMFIKLHLIGMVSIQSTCCLLSGLFLSNASILGFAIKSVGSPSTLPAKPPGQKGLTTTESILFEFIAAVQHGAV